MYLHYILIQEDHELVARFFKAQSVKPVKNDWYLSVVDDLKEFEIDMTFEDIKEMKKGKFKDIIKGKIREKAFNDLQNLKNIHSKLDNIKYEEFKIQDYFINNNEDSRIAKSIFKFRTRMVDVHENFKNSYRYKESCPLGCVEKDEQSHLLKCEKLSAVHDNSDENDYFDIFSDNSSKIKNVSKNISEMH